MFLGHHVVHVGNLQLGVTLSESFDAELGVILIMGDGGHYHQFEFL